MQSSDQHVVSPLAGSWWKPSRVECPPLPHELWLKIISYATNVPGALDTDCRDQFQTPPRPSLVEEQKAIRQSLVTKRYIVRVSKTLCVVGMPFLYESILVGRGRTLSSLAKTLLASKAKSENIQSNDPNSRQAHSLGSWTRRLDLLMRGETHDTSSELESIACIITCLPNLAIFISCPTTPQYLDLPMPRQIARALATTCGRALRHVRICNDALFPQWSSWAEFLDQSHSLETIHQASSIPPMLDRDDVRSFMVLDKWTQHPDEYVPKQSAFANLHELIFVASESTGAVLPLIHALSRFGRHLTRLVIEGEGFIDYDDNLEVINQHCPSLTHLCLMLWAWDGLPSSATLPRTLTHLGLRCRRRQSFTEEYEMLFDSLSYLDAPALRVVRFLDAATVKDIQLRHASVLALAEKVANRRSWLFEDHCGAALAIQAHDVS